jgi:carbonic anhydrase
VPAMSVIDEVLAANEIYSRTHELRNLTPRPERKLAVLTCMDTRLSIRTLGLKTGDAHIIRNAGGIVTDDTLRSLLVSHYLLGTEEFMVINHTDCGLMSTTEQDLRTRHGAMDLKGARACSASLSGPVRRRIEPSQLLSAWVPAPRTRVNRPPAFCIRNGEAPP